MSDQHSQALSIPPCPSRDRFKKALRLIRDRFILRLVPGCTPTSTDSPMKDKSVTIPEGIVAVADRYVQGTVPLRRTPRLVKIQLRPHQV